MGWSYAQGSYIVRLFGHEERDFADGLAARARADLQLRAHAPDAAYEYLVIAVDSAERTELVVSVAYAPGARAGFHPAVALIEETGVLFVGAGTHAYALDVKRGTILTAHPLELGFWQWKRVGELVLMSAELELAAFDLRGELRWTAAVEPPWSCVVQGDEVEVDVMDQPKRRFPLARGP